jgi:hypothetical protein
MSTQQIPQWTWGERWEFRLQAVVRLVWAAAWLLAALWLFSPEAQAQAAPAAGALGQGFTLHSPVGELLDEGCGKQR